MSGKSTIANAIVSGSAGMTVIEKTGRVLPKNKLIYENREVFQLRHGLTEMQHEPYIYPLDDESDAFLLDLPGFSIEDQSLELLTMRTIQQVAHQANHFMILLVFRGN